MLKEIEKPRQHTGDTHQAHKPRAVKGAVKKRVHTCRRGDIVIHIGKKMWVNEILEQGVEEYMNVAGLFVAGVRAVISACNVMESGQVIKRAPRYIEDQWFHE